MPPKVCYLPHLSNPMNSGSHWEKWNSDPWKWESLILWVSHVRGLLLCLSRWSQSQRHHELHLVDIHPGVETFNNCLLINTLGGVLSAVDISVSLSFPSGFGQNWIVKNRSISPEDLHIGDTSTLVECWKEASWGLIPCPISSLSL